MSVQVLVFGGESKWSEGYAAALILRDAGHRVTLMCRAQPREQKAKDGLDRISAPLSSTQGRRLLARADAVLDTRIPSRVLATKREDIRQAVQEEFRSSNRAYIAASSPTVVGDTGATDARERARVSKRSAPFEVDYERSILGDGAVNSFVVRPAMPWGRFGLPEGLKLWVSLATRLRRGAYIGEGTNRLTAVHCDDLASLYAAAVSYGLASDRPELRVFHAAGTTYSAKELATALHQCMGGQGEARSLTLTEAQRYTPFAAALARGTGLSSHLTRKVLRWVPVYDSLILGLEEHALEWALRF